MIAIGAFSPLTGFMGDEDFARVCTEMRLANGTVWPIPVILSPARRRRAKINEGEGSPSRTASGRLLGDDEDHREVQARQGTGNPQRLQDTDDAHPGVKIVRGRATWNLAGPIDVITPNPSPEFAEYRLPPAKTREAFAAKGWKTVAAFQTRNPIHRRHEYLTKCALEITDGLLIHPLVGETKSDDIPAEVRMKCYRALIDKYYNKNRTMLSVMPLAMRYAGPREAILHALIRKNYGVTHFIVGRDHAGVGNYYGTYDAQKIFDQLTCRTRSA